MSKKSDKLFAVITIICALVLALFRIAVTLFYTEDKIGVYVTDSIFPKILDYAVALVTIAAVLFPCFRKNNYKCKSAKSETKLTLFTTAVLGFMFIALSLSFILSMLTKNNSGAVEISFAVFGVLSSIYYLSKIFAREVNPGFRALFSMIPIVWTVITLIEVYFDLNALITSPNRAYHQTALLAFALFILAQARVEIGFENNLLYAPSAAAATILLAVSSLANLICPHILSVGHTDRPIVYALEFAAFLYCASKLFVFCSDESKVKE